MLQLKSNGFWSASFFRKAESSYEDWTPHMSLYRRCYSILAVPLRYVIGPFLREDPATAGICH
jgi:hypothetical protein